MKFVLAAIVLAAIIAIVLLLLLCCVRRYSTQCVDRRRPLALQFDDDMSQKRLLEEGEDEPPNQRTPSLKRLPPQNRYFVLGGHRFEATASGYRQIDDEASYDPSEAQKLALSSDENNANLAANYENMIDGSDDNPKPRKTRHPLAVQFSAMAHAAENSGVANLEPNATRQFMHETKPSDNYVWPSRGGPATPIHVEWGGNTGPSSATEKHEQNAETSDEKPATQDDLHLELATDEAVAEDIASSKEVGDNHELLVKTDQQIVPKPKSKKGKKQPRQQQLEQEIQL